MYFDVQCPGNMNCWFVFGVINFVNAESVSFMCLLRVFLCRVWSVQCTFGSIIRKPSEHIRNSKFVLREKHESLVSSKYMANGHLYNMHKLFDSNDKMF